MSLCSTPRCENKHHAKGLCHTCYTQKIRNKSVTIRNKKSVTKRNITAPEVGGCVTHGERKGNSSISIKEHNGIFHFEILTDDYFFDKIAWKLRGNNKYSHVFIRDALGYFYDPAMKGKKPPFSVVKGKHTKTIEVFVNLDATEAQIWTLLERIKEQLESDLNASLSWPPKEIEWKQGPEKGKPVRDYTVKSPYPVKLGQESPDLVGYQAERRPEDPHDNAILGDGSHPDAAEFRDKESAETFDGIQKDVGVKDPANPKESHKVSTAANNIVLIREGVEAIPKKTDREREYLSETGLGGSIRRQIRENAQVHSYGLTEVHVAISRTRTEVGSLKEEQVLIGANLGKVAAVMETFGRDIQEHLKLVDAVNKAAEALREAQGPRPKYAHLYRGRSK